MTCFSNPHTQCHTEKETPVRNRTKQSISSHSSLCSAFFVCMLFFCECSIQQKHICSLTGCVKRSYSELCRACTGHWLYLLSPQSFHISFWHFSFSVQSSQLKIFPGNEKKVRALLLHPENLTSRSCITSIQCVLSFLKSRHSVAPHAVSPFSAV